MTPNPDKKQTSSHGSEKAATFNNPSRFATPVPQGINYLLAIGIDAYQHCPKLYNCVRDAEEVIQVLTERYRFETRNIFTIFNGKASRSNIYRAFREMAQRVTPKDNLLIYFSGHGEYDSIFKEGFWIPVEAQAGNHDQYIPNSMVKKFLAAINSHHTFLMSDSCFAGALFAKGVKNIEKRYENDPSRWGLTAGRNEVVSDGQPGDHSPFAESLLYRLRHNTDSMGVQELCLHVTEYVQANTNQSPIGEPLKVDGHKNGQFVFHLKKDEKRDWAVAQQEDTLGAYERFFAMYPAGKYADQASNRIAFLKVEAAWEKAKKEHTVHGYNKFDDAYPNSRYSQDALNAIKELEEEASWQKALRFNKLSYFKEYKREYPHGKYRSEADLRIKAIMDANREPAFWKRTTQQHTIKAYEAYLDQYPEGVYVEEAQSLLAELQKAEQEQRAKEQALLQKEDQRWEEALGEDSENAYQTYLDDYPEGRYVDEAQKGLEKLKALERQAAEERKEKKENDKKRTKSGKVQRV